MMAAINFVKKESPKKIVVAVPLSPKDTLDKLKSKAEVVCAYIPPLFHAIGNFYDDFPQVQDEEAIELLEAKK